MEVPASDCMDRDRDVDSPRGPTHQELAIHTVPRQCPGKAKAWRLAVQWSRTMASKLVGPQGQLCAEGHLHAASLLSSLCTNR